MQGESTNQYGGHMKYNEKIVKLLTDKGATYRAIKQVIKPGDIKRFNQDLRALRRQGVINATTIVMEYTPKLETKMVYWLCEQNTDSVYGKSKNRTYRVPSRNEKGQFCWKPIVSKEWKDEHR